MLDAAPRRSTRVLIADPADRLLLLHVSLPDGRRIWLPPGGGVENDETFEQAAVREVREETGITLVSTGSCVWTRRTNFFDNDQLEHFFFARVEAVLEVTTDRNPSAAEIAALRGHRWWSVEENAAATDQDFVPRELARHLAPLLRGDLPDQPFDVGI